MRNSDLSGEICKLMARHGATDLEGITAMTTTLIVAFVTNRASKETAFQILNDSWDKLAPAIRKKWEAQKDA